MPRTQSWSIAYLRGVPLLHSEESRLRSSEPTAAAFPQATAAMVAGGRASLSRIHRNRHLCEASCRCATAGANSRPAPGRGFKSRPASPTSVERRRRGGMGRGRGAAGERLVQAIRHAWLLAQDGKTDAKGRPKPLQAAVFSREVADTIRFTSPPQLVQRLLFGLPRPIARATGHRGLDPSMPPGDPANPRPARPRVASSVSATPTTYRSRSCATAAYPYGEQRPCHWKERTSLTVVC